MPCFHPLTAWKKRGGQVILAKEPPDSTRLNLPCGGCLGCRAAAAKAWALRCQLELQQHDNAVFSTLTYDDEHLPITLAKRHLQLFLKRLRRASNQPVRFFASGEYGETTNRPHYHAILYGLRETQRSTIERTWGLGHVRTGQVTPASIAYTAGYTSKKIGFKLHQEERVDPDTGEVYTWEPPFIQMSRRPGIGHAAKKWTQSWRLYAIHNGQQQPVPRYLHEAWKAQATEEQKEELIYEKQSLSRYSTKEQREAQEKIAVARQKEASRKRKYG